MKLAVFDFDGTLFPKDTLPFLLSEWKRQKYSKWRYFRSYSSLIVLYIKYKILKNKSGGAHQQSREQVKLAAMEKFYRIFSGMSEEEVNAFMEKSARFAQPLLDASVVKEIERARSEGFHTVLLSGAYSNFLQYIGAYLQMDTVIGTNMHFENGRFDADYKPEVVTGGLKIERMRQNFPADGVDWQGSRAYADSYSDADILSAVGYPVCVHPDAALLELASEKKWAVME